MTSHPGRLAVNPDERATMTTGSEARKTHVTAAVVFALRHVQELNK